MQPPIFSSAPKAATKCNAFLSSAVRETMVKDRAGKMRHRVAGKQFNSWTPTSKIDSDDCALSQLKATIIQ